jgi:hypothetical protein
LKPRLVIVQRELEDHLRVNVTEQPMAELVNDPEGELRLAPVELEP